MGLSPALLSLPGPPGLPCGFSLASLELHQTSFHWRPARPTLFEPIAGGCEGVSVPPLVLLSFPGACSLTRWQNSMDPEFLQSVLDVQLKNYSRSADRGEN